MVLVHGPAFISVWVMLYSDTEFVGGFLPHDPAAGPWEQLIAKYPHVVAESPQVRGLNGRLHIAEGQ